MKTRKILWQDNNNDERLSFLGKEKDEESDLGDYGVRKYDDLTGRFTATDPLWEKYYGWSPYNYTGNNPINRTDLSGLNWFSNYNGDYKWLDQQGSHSDVKTSDTWFDNGKNYPFPMQSEALYDNNEDFISNGGGKVASILKKIIFTFIDVDNKEESGLERYTQENVNKIVENAVKDNGGNVTVMRDGVELFRVRATGHGDDKNATYTLRKYNNNPKYGLVPGDYGKANRFSDKQVDMLLYGINGVNGYSIKTKGGR